MVVVAPGAGTDVVVVDVATPGFDRVAAEDVVGVTAPDPAAVLTVVGVEVGAAVAPGVAVGEAGVEGAWAGGTSVDALQICAYEGVTPGGGSLGPAGSLFWNRHPSTSFAGLETDCPAGPLLA